MNECMKRSSVESITVRQICAQGDFSRQTFYRCFRDKYDLINWYFDRILHESFDQMGKGRTVREGLIRKFDYIQQEYIFFKAGFSSDEQNNLKEHDFEMIFTFYKNLIKEKSGIETNEETTALLEMYCQSSVYMTVKWIMNGCRKSSEELADLMVNAMPLDLAQLFKRLEILN